MHLDGVDQIDLSIVIFTNLWNVYRQEEEQGADQGAGEDRCHPSACKRRLRAMQSQSPNDIKNLGQRLHATNHICFTILTKEQFSSSEC